MSNSIVIASGKGGVGKSTTACALASALARTGHKTLIVDCDAGMNSVNIMLNCENTALFSWYDVYTGNCEITDAVKNVRQNLYIMNAPAKRLTQQCEDAVGSAVGSVKDDYEFILFDAPAGLGTGLRRAALAADKALIVATGDAISVNGAAAVDSALSEAGVNSSRLIINRYDLKAAKKGKYLNVDEIIDRSYVRLLGIVPEDKNIMYYSVTKQLDRRSKSLAAYDRIAKRLCGENVVLTLSLLK